MSSSIGFESIWKLNSRVVLCRIRPFPTLILEIKWLGFGLPLILRIDFRYDFAGLGVEIVETREKISSLVTRLCGILGGIFASSGILSSLIHFFSKST